MCDLIYLNLLRENVRRLQAEEKRAAALGNTPTFGTAPHERFLPRTMPAQSQS
jgi:hypothetical protein